MNATAASIVFVHGGFVDGSGWESVHKILKKDGYDVSVVQNPTKSLADDVAFAGRVVCIPSQRPGRARRPFLRGRGRHRSRQRARRLRGLAYIAAFAPDKGESVSSLIQNPAPGDPVPPILPPQDGYLRLDQAKFALRSRGRRRADRRLHG